MAATKDGGFVPCAGRPYRLPDRSRAVRALSWEQTEAIRERFAALNPSDRAIVLGSVFKLEDENFIDTTRTQRCNLWYYGASEKSYALFTLDDRGEPVLRKHSAHVLGQYRSPIPGDRDGWMRDAWKREIREALGTSVEPFDWEAYPAIAPLTLTTWSVFKTYRTNDRLRPFDFLALGTMSRDIMSEAIEKVTKRRCCEQPRPACPLFSDAATYKQQDWRCLGCGEPWDFQRRPRLATYRQVVTQTLQGTPRKRLCSDARLRRSSMPIR